MLNVFIGFVYTMHQILSLLTLSSRQNYDQLLPWSSLHSKFSAFTLGLRRASQLYCFLVPFQYFKFWVPYPKLPNHRHLHLWVTWTELLAILSELWLFCMATSILSTQKQLVICGIVGQRLEVLGWVELFLIDECNLNLGVLYSNWDWSHLFLHRSKMQF